MTSFLGTLAGSDSNTTSGSPSKPNNSVNLTEYIEKQNSLCLNEDSDHTYSNLFVPDPALCLKSDCDEQLLLQIGFREPVNLQFIEIKFEAGNISAPKTIKFFRNIPNLDFDTAEIEKPTDTYDIDTTTQANGSVRIQMVPMRWNNCSTLTAFVVDSHGSEVCVVHNFNIFGTPTGGLKNVNDIGKNC